MERGARAHAVRHGRCRPHDEPAAHAVALRADLLVAIDLFLRVEPSDERGRVLLDGAVGLNRLHERRQLRTDFLEADLRGIVTQHRRLAADAVERVRDQHGVARLASLLAMSRIDVRSPNASGQMITAGWAPLAG